MSRHNLSHLALSVLPLVLALQQTASAQQVAFDRSPDAVVVHYLEQLDGLRDADPGPSITVYGDGRALIHTPRYMQNAGDRIVRLRPHELQDLLDGLVADGVLALDTQALAEPDAAAAGGGGQKPTTSAPLHHISHESTTVLEVNVRPGGSRARGAHRVALRGLDRRVAENPNSDSLAHFAAAERRVQALRQHPRLSHQP